MAQIDASGPNSDQIAFWNGDVGQKWARNRAALNRFLAPITAQLMEFTVPRSGERVLDIGCGCGETSIALQARVGREGKVTGIDISEPMLAFAKADAKGGAPEFILADAEAYRFADAAFDLAFSRFGVMFFSAPVKAFANIRKAMKPDGRLSFVCWQALKANAWVSVPLQAALQHLPPPTPPDPNAPGPFAFADSDRLRNILRDAGFKDIAIEPRAIPLSLGAMDDAVYLATEMGPLSRMLIDANPDDKTRAAVAQAVRGALAQHETKQGITLGGACFLVGARV